MGKARHSGTVDRLRRVEPRQISDFPGQRYQDHMDGLKPQTPVDLTAEEKARGVFPIDAGERREED